jgi:tetratricopeptide (TPR) repeat protein
MDRPLLVRRMKSRLSRLQDKLDASGELTPLEHFEKAELHRDLEQFEEAIVHYQRAAEQESLATMALTKMAASLADRGMYDLAGETLEQIELTRELTETHPELKELVYTVARALEKIRRIDQAVTFYKRIFRVDAAYQDVVERIERLT